MCAIVMIRCVCCTSDKKIMPLHPSGSEIQNGCELKIISILQLEFQRLGIVACCK